MTYSVPVTSGKGIGIPKWGRCFWQDPTDGYLFLSYVTGNAGIVYTYSTDSGNSWAEPTHVAPIDDFSIHWNYDSFMDPRGHMHFIFAYNGSGCYQFLGKIPGGAWTASSGEDAPQPYVKLNAQSSDYSRNLAASIALIEAEDTVGFVGNPQVFTEHPCPKIVIPTKVSGDNYYWFSIHTPFKGYPTGITPFFPPGPPFGHEYPPNEGLYGVGFNTHGMGPVAYPTCTTHYRRDSVGYVTNNLTAGEPGQGTNLFAGYNAGASVNFTSAGNQRTKTVQNIGWTSGLDFCTAVFIVGAKANPDIWFNSNAIASTTGSTNVGWNLTAMNQLAEVFDARGHITGVQPSVNGHVNGLVHSMTSSGLYGTVESGCIVDVSFNENREFVLYALKEDEYGIQSIARAACKTRQPPLGQVSILVPNINIYPSGWQYVVQATPTIAGGKDGVPHIENFRCLKHPTQPTTATPAKAERLVSVTTLPLTESGIQSLIVWSPTESVAYSNEFKLPRFLTDYTRQSGEATFSGIVSSFRITNPHRLFDSVAQSNQYGHDDLSFLSDFTTFATVESGANMILAFNKPIMIDRIDAMGDTGAGPPNFGDTGKIVVSGSLDGDLYYPVGIVTSGRLTSLIPNRFWMRGFACDYAVIRTAGYSTTPANRSLYMHTHAKTAKFLKFEWHMDTLFTRTVYDLKILGPSNTTFGIIRDTPFMSTALTPLITRLGGYEARKSIQRMERFRHEHGTLPPNFLTYGDFNWGIVASGKFTTSHEIPGYTQEASYAGRVPSGLFKLINASNGYDDGFAAFVSPYAQNKGPGQTGLMQYPLYIQPKIYAPGTTATLHRSGDYISFYLRADMHPDDEFTFITKWGNGANAPAVAPLEGWSVAATSGTQRIKLSGVFTNWIKYNFFLQAGPWDLIWQYRRGSTVDSNRYGAIWIDNFFGASGDPWGSINGFAQTSTPYATGHIYGFASGLDTKNSQILGFASGAKYEEIIYGYTKSAVEADAMSTILGCVLGGKHSDIYGFVLGSSGIDETTYPTGYIMGFVGVPSGSGPSDILGYVEGDWGRTIHGYLRGFGEIGLSGVTNPEATGNQRIFGLVKAFPAQEYIYGVVGAPSGTPSGSIHGFVDARHALSGQVIYGFVGAPSGTTSNIYGYSQGTDGGFSYLAPGQSVIFGHIASIESGTSQIYGYSKAQLPNGYILGYLGSQALVASGGGSVGGGPGAGSPSTSNVVAGTNFIHGVLKGVDGPQTIYGFVQAPPGGADYIWGYVLAGADQAIVYGYGKGKEIAATGILGYVSGVGFADSSTFGYLFGVSGIETSRIYGFAIGEEYASSKVLGTLIGMTSGVSSLAACPSHNFFPLNSVPTVVLPSAIYNPFA